MKNVIGKVIIHGIEELAKFVAILNKEGTVFEATPQENEHGVTSYIVEFNGGC